MKKPLNVRLPIDVINRFKIACIENEHTIEWGVESALERFLEKHETLKTYRKYGTEYNPTDVALRRTTGGETT